MIEVTYLNTAKQEKYTSFEDSMNLSEHNKLVGLLCQMQRQSLR